MTSSTAGLVPITRAFLARYYDKYPVSPLPEDVARFTTELRVLSDGLIRDVLPVTPAEETFMHEMEQGLPHKIDQNLWKNRENIEEILFLLEEPHWRNLLQVNANSEDTQIVAILKELTIKLKNTLKLLGSCQQKNADNVFNTVMTYMPQDFRGSLIRQQRERSERNRQADIDALIKSGGSIHDQYALLWQQQMERRRQLAQLGSATGVYKTLVKYLVGVPQVLLDFLRQINDDQGPMEEQRQRYGPTLYTLTNLLLSIRLFLLVSWGRFHKKKIDMAQLLLLRQAVDLYTSEFEKFIEFIGEVFTHSPFFITAEDAGAVESRKIDDYKETIVPTGKTHEITLTIDSVNSYIAWDFSLIQGTLTLDIGFHVEYVSPSGDRTLILPYKRCESDQGNFCTVLTGSYKLIWDNSYSTFFKKNLRYKVDAIPPVVDASQSALES